MPMTQMQRQHLIAENAATQEQRPFSRSAYITPQRWPDPNAHVTVWRNHKINATLDHFIANYSLTLNAVG